MARTLARFFNLLLLLGMLGITRCESPAIGGDFTCEGKKVCAEMTSCAEARFYLNECGLKTMDGDNDGVPCEVEHCVN